MSDNPGTRLRSKTKDAEALRTLGGSGRGGQRRDIYREKESLQRSGTGNSGVCIQSGELRLCPIRRGRLMGSSSHFRFSVAGRFCEEHFMEVIENMIDGEMSTDTVQEHEVS